MHDELIGTMAGTLTTIAFIPQVVRIWRTKHAEDISTSMFVIFITGVTLWLLYGLRLHARPIIIANTITLALSVTILALKFYFKRQNRCAKTE